MGLLSKYYSNYRHPKGLLGRYVVRAMNGKRHGALAEWALNFVDIKEDAHVLDIGCGGGANVARMLAKYPKGTVNGVDFAPAAIQIARRLNSQAILKNRCRIIGGNAKMLPVIKDTIDFATAFETVYYWPAFELCLLEIYRVLKSGGYFLIANETDGIDPNGEKWAKLIGHMYIYTAEELKDCLVGAGFINVTIHHDPATHYLCAIAQKP